MMLLKAIGQTQAKFIAQRDPREAFADLLEILLEVTSSGYGFIGEVHHTPDGKRYLTSHAISNIAWNAETKALYEESKQNGLDFHNLETLFGRVLKDGHPVISNEPAADPRRGGIPAGHPSLDAFLGLPIYAGTELVGMAGIANRPGGYDESIVEFLDPLLMTCSNILLAHRSEESRKEAESKRLESEERLLLAMEGPDIGMWEWYLRTGDTVCNDRVYQMGGFEPGEISLDHATWKERVHPEDRPWMEKALTAYLKGQTDNFKAEFRWQTKSGVWAWFISIGRFVEWDEEGTPTRMAGIQLDQSEHKRAEEQFRLVFDAAPNGMLILDLQGKISLVNNRIEQLFGYDRAELIGKSIDMLVPDPCRDEQKSLLDLVKLGVATDGRELAGVRKDGTDFSLEIGLDPIETMDGTNILASVVDVTERKRLQSEIKHQAFHDALTGLPNRLLFMDRLSIAQARAKRHMQGVAVIFIDLDNFKVINDSLGHQAGDRFLMGITDRLRSCVRPEDTVARLGGDEFTVLLEELRDVDDAIKVADRLVEAIRQPYSIPNAHREVVSTASVGIAFSCNGEEQADTLLRDADTAMYYAKESGKAAYVLFDPSMNSKAVERMELELGLRQALDRDEFRLYYQPIVNLFTGRVVGAEALIRWEHPTRGLVPPDQFIPIAEETGLIGPIGHWALETACYQLRKWLDAFGEQSGLTMSVNLSGRQLQRRDIVDQVIETLQTTRVEASSLKLEITESVLMNDVEDAIGKLRGLRGLGIKLAVDDFGTGYSSMSSLSSFPVDTVKIDRAFISRLCIDDDAEAIVAAVIMLSKSIRLETTAEGLENQEQLMFLKALGCNCAQGYYFARPLPAEECGKWLAETLAERRSA